MIDYKLYVSDIVSAIDSIQEFVVGMDLAAFQADDKTASAVMRKLEIILIHFYFGIDYGLVWKTIFELFQPLRLGARK